MSSAAHEAVVDCTWNRPFDDSGPPSITATNPPSNVVSSDPVARRYR